MTKKLSREENLQRAVVQHLRMRLPPSVVWYSVPNSPRNAVAGARLKATGMRAGVADLAFVIKGRAYFIEMKCDKDAWGQRTYLEKAQKDFRDDVRLAGGEYAVCRSSQEVLECLEAWGVQLLLKRHGVMEEAA